MAVAPVASILEGALCVLREPDPYAKAAIAEALAACCADLPLAPPPPPQAGRAGGLAPPPRPARPTWLATVDVSRAPRRGRGGTVDSRVAMLHALVHIESWAIDLAADCVARFAAAAAAAESGAKSPPPTPSPYPRQLATDFVAVMADEARHFSLLDARLREVHPQGRGYGCLPAHEGLWESAQRTARSLPARLAVESCLHEARGLDRLPLTVSRFRAGGDDRTADLLEGVVLGEEVAHCAAGVRWLTFLHARARGEGERGALGRASAAAGAAVAFPLAPPGRAPPGEAGGGAALAEGGRFAARIGGGGGDKDEGEDEAAPGSPAFGAPAGFDEEDWREDARRHATPALWFRSLVARHFHGRLMPPFNEEARARAGLTREWYAEEEEEEGGRAAGEGRTEEKKRATSAAAAAAAAGARREEAARSREIKGV